MLIGLVSDVLDGSKKDVNVDYKQIPYRSDIEDLMTFDGLIVNMKNVLQSLNGKYISSQFTRNLTSFRDEKRPVMIIMPDYSSTIFNYYAINGSFYGDKTVIDYLNYLYPGLNIKHKKYTLFDEQQFDMQSINVLTTYYTFDNIVSLGSARKTNESVFGFSEIYNVLLVPFVESYENVFRVFSYFEQVQPIEKTPEWIKKTFILNEKDIIKDVKLINEQISCLTNEVTELEKTLIYYSKIKSIVFTSGDYLQDTVLHILRNEFKFDIIPNHVKNEDDIIVKYNNRYLVIEVKGVKGSITSKHVMQATKWTTEFILKNIETETDIDKRVRASLIGNPMKDLPIESRVDEFPEDTIRIASSNNVSMIRTITLLNLFQDFKSGKLNKEHFFSVLYDEKALIEYEQFR